MNLTWDSYSTHLETMLVGMMTSSDYTDVTLVCGGDQVQFKAHKVVLSASSPVMRNILQSYNTENPVIYLRGVQHEDMEAILQFIYLGEASVKHGRTEEFLKLAKDFEIKTCLSKDQENIGIRTESSCKVNPLEKSQCEETNSNEIETITSDIDVSIDVKEEALSETEYDDSLTFDNIVNNCDSTEHHDYDEEFDFVVGELVVKEDKDDVEYNPVGQRAKSKKKRLSTEHFDISGISCGKKCKICGHSTQRRMRMLKHYCTVHFTDELTKYFNGNTCTICGYESFPGKVLSRAIHVGLQHKVIQQILTKNAIAFNEPRTNFKNVPRVNNRKVSLSENLEADIPSEVAPLVPWRDKNSSSEGMKKIQKLGNSCLKCGKEFKFFRSSLLPHYCGHFYSEIAKHIEPFFTDDKCNLCGSHASQRKSSSYTQRKSKVIHLGTAHELVLKFIEKLKIDQESGDAQQNINIPPPEDSNKTC